MLVASCQIQKYPTNCVWIVSEKTQPNIAIIAEEATDLARLVVMIYGQVFNLSLEHPILTPAARGTDTTLLTQASIVLVNGDTVFLLELGVANLNLLSFFPLRVGSPFQLLQLATPLVRPTRPLKVTFPPLPHVCGP